MSSTFKIVAGLLACLAVALVWFTRGDEASAPGAPRKLEKPSHSGFQKPKRRMLLDQPGMHDQVDNSDSGAQHREVAKSRLEARSQKMKQRRTARDARPTPGAAESEDLAHWRDVVLNNPDPDERADALTQIDYDEPDAIAVLVDALQDKEPEVRLAALDELWVNADEPPLDILGPVLSDPDAEVRAEAVRMIAESEEDRAAELLEKALADPDEDVRDEAADALELDDDQL